MKIYNFRNQSNARLIIGTNDFQLDIISTQLGQFWDPADMWVQILIEAPKMSDFELRQAFGNRR